MGEVAPEKNCRIKSHVSQAVGVDRKVVLFTCSPETTGQYIGLKICCSDEDVLNWQMSGCTQHRNTGFPESVECVKESLVALFNLKANTNLTTFDNSIDITGN